MFVHFSQVNKTVLQLFAESYHRSTVFYPKICVTSRRINVVLYSYFAYWNAQIFLINGDGIKLMKD